MKGPLGMVFKGSGVDSPLGKEKRDFNFSCLLKDFYNLFPLGILVVKPKRFKYPLSTVVLPGVRRALAPKWM